MWFALRPVAQDSRSDGRPNEPTVLKLDSATATRDEAENTRHISSLVGATLENGAAEAWYFSIFSHII